MPASTAASGSDAEPAGSLEVAAGAVMPESKSLLVMTALADPVGFVAPPALAERPSVASGPTRVLDDGDADVTGLASGSPPEPGNTSGAFGSWPQPTQQQTVNPIAPIHPSTQPILGIYHDWTPATTKPAVDVEGM